MRGILKTVSVVALVATFAMAEKGPEIASASAQVNIPATQIVSGQDSFVGIDVVSATDVAGVQFSVRYDADKIRVGDPVMNKANSNFSIHSSVKDGIVKVIAFSLTGDQVILGEGAEILIPVKSLGNYLGNVNLEIVDMVVAAQDATEIQSSGSVGEITVAMDIPTTYDIQQNFPNPFNPTTTINYQLPKDSQVALVIYNMLGQEVKTLVEDNLDAGYYSVTWDGTDNFGKMIASGEYIYSITADDFNKNMKMVFLK